MMKRIINKIFSLLTLLAVLNGCSDFLDNKPKGMTIPSQTEDYEKLLNGISTTVGALPLYLSDDVKLLDKTGSASGYIFINQDDEVRNLYSFQEGQIYVAGAKDETWNQAYSRIFTYNIVINDVMKSEGASETKKMRIKAEALIGRAFEYFQLVNIYAAQYDSATAASDYGVPYITEGNINIRYGRNTVAEVYDAIIADIREALPALSVTTSYTTHPDKNSANALLAKIYLTMGDYQKALEYAKTVLKEKHGLLNLNDYEKKEGVTWGRVHLKGDESRQIPNINHPEAIYARFSSGQLRTAVCASDGLRQIFKQDLPEGAVDLRKEFFFSEDQVNLGRLDYIPGECAYVLYVDENIGLTTVETMFIAAECEARIGNASQAMAYVNMIRDNRIAGNVALTASGKDEALGKVLDEKRRELCLKGIYRYMDLKRLNKEDRFKKTIVHGADGESWTLEPNSAKWIFPVNQEVLDYHPEMPQYDRK